MNACLSAVSPPIKNHKEGLKLLDRSFYCANFLACLPAHLAVTVESVGMYEPQEIVKEAIQILKQKALSFS